MNSIIWVCLFTLLPGFLMASIAFLGGIGFLTIMAILLGIPVVVQYRREKVVKHY